MDFIQWNIRGLRANCRDLELLVKNFKPSVIALQETLLPQEKRFSLNNFVCISKPAAENFSKRGVSLFIHNSVLYKPIDLQTDLEAVAARVSLEKAVTVCSLYLSPSTVVSKHQLEALIAQLPEPMILLGDLNGHSPLWGSEETNNQGKVVEDFVSDHDLCILNSGSPTFCSSQGTLTHVDLSLCHASLFLDFDWKVHSDLCGSDHFPVLLNFGNHSEEEARQLWNFKSANWELFEQLALDRTPAVKLMDSQDPIAEFSKILLECAKESIPTSLVKPKFVKTPWFDDDCKKLKKEREKALRTFVRFPTDENKMKHQALRAKCRFMFKNKKKESWEKFCSNLSYKTDTRKVWKIVNKIKGKTNKESVTCLNVDGEIVTDKKDVTNTLAESFHQNSSSSHYCAEFQAIKERVESKSCSFPEDDGKDYNLPFNMNELIDAILKSNNSAPGPDEIHYQIIRHLPKECLQILLSLFNRIWTTDYFPSSWREAVIIPVPKPGKDHSNPNNYRPIALTSCLCKTMERMVYVRLLWELEYLGALDTNQCGFRKDRSTTDHLVRFEGFTRNALTNGDQVVAVLFDLEKAYDTTWKYGILQDLAGLGLVGNLPFFVDKFLANRRFCVRLRSTCSDSFDQEMGVPQGSILSPLLFNLKVNNIVKAVNPGIEKFLFVDDFAILARGKTLVGIERQLQLCINRLQRWVTENGFKFSTLKTECIHFHRKRTQILGPELTLNGQVLKVSRQVKFLGIIFDDKMTFLPHIKYLKRICQTGLNVIKVVSHTDWGANKNTLLRLYRALVRSKLDYGCIVYGSARKSYIKALDPIHHQGLRIALGAFRTSPVQSLYAEAGEPPLELRRLKLAMNYYLKLKASPGNPTYDLIIDPPCIRKFVQKPNEIPPLGLRIQSPFKDAEIDVGNVDDNELRTVTPPWKLKSPLIDLQLHQYKKDSLSCLAFKQLYLEQCGKYKGFTRIFTDGSKKEERSAAAFVVNSSFAKPTQVRLPNHSSVYTAELKALLLALQEVLRSSRRKFLILSDSLSALAAFKSRNISHPILADLHDLHTDLVLKRKNVVFMWIPSHTGIYGNDVADKAAKEALNYDIPDMAFQFVPHRDLRSKVSAYCFKLWQQDWLLQINNKLFKVCSDLSVPLPSRVNNRKQESVLSRLHIGHTYLTHGWILRREDPPRCDKCDCPQSVLHIFFRMSRVYRRKK